MNNTTWHEKAQCNAHPDPDLWHYESSDFPDEQRLQVLRTVEAITICRSCPVKKECLAQGMEKENLEYTGGGGSIWGGLLNSQRYSLKHKTHSITRTRIEARHLRDVGKELARISK